MLLNINDRKRENDGGKIYDPSDEELVKLRTKAHRLSKEYNELLETDEKRSEILKEMGIIGDRFTCRDQYSLIMAV